MAAANTGFVGEFSSTNVAMAGQNRVLDQTTFAWMDGVTEPRDEAIPSIEQDDTRPANRPDHQAAIKETAKRHTTRSTQVGQNSPAPVGPAPTLKILSTPRRKSSKAPARNESDRGPRVRSPEPPVGNQRGALSSPTASFPIPRPSLGMMRVSRVSYADRRARRRRLLAIAQPLANIRDTGTHKAGKR